MSAPYVHNAPPDLEIGSKEWHDFYESNKKWPKQWVDVLYTKGLGLSSEHHAELKKDIAINLDRLNLRNVNLKSKEVQNTVTGLAQTLIKQYQSKMRNAAATKSYTFRAISGEISRVKGTKLKAVKQERWETPIDIDAADESAPPSTLSVADNTSDQTRKRSISAVNEENRQSSFDSRSQAGSSQGNRFDPKFSRMRVSREYYIYTYVQQLELEHYCLIHDITRITAEQNPTIDDLDYERWTVSLAQYLSEVDLSLKDVRIWYEPRKTERVATFFKHCAFEIRSAADWLRAIRQQMNDQQTCIDFYAYLRTPEDHTEYSQSLSRFYDLGVGEGSGGQAERESSPQSPMIGPTDPDPILSESSQSPGVRSKRQRREVDAEDKEEEKSISINAPEEMGSDGEEGPVVEGDAAEAKQESEEELNRILKELEAVPKCEQLTLEIWQRDCKLLGIDEGKHRNPANKITLPGFKVPIFPYQVRGACFMLQSWSSPLGVGVLGDDMGWGMVTSGPIFDDNAANRSYKSLQTILAIYLNYMIGRMRHHLAEHPEKHNPPWNADSETPKPTQCPCYGKFQIPCPCVPDALSQPDHGFECKDGPVLLLVPAGLIANWIADFKRHVDEVFTGLHLLYAHSDKIPDGVQLDPKKHAGFLIATAEGTARPGQAAYIVLTSQESYPSRVKIIKKPFQKAAVLGGKATPRMLEVAKTRAKIDIRFSIVCRDEFHQQVNKGAGAIRILEGFLWHPWLGLISGTPIRCDASRLVDYFRTLNPKAWRDPKYACLAPENMTDLNTRIALTSKDCSALDTLREVAMQLNQCLQLMLIRRTEVSLWFGVACKDPIKLRLVDVPITLKPQLLKELNEFYQGQVIEMQATVDIQHKDWVLKGKKGNEPKLNIDLVRHKGKLTRILATFPYLRILKQQYPYLSFTNYDILGNFKGMKEGSARYESFMKYDQTIQFKNISLIADAPKIEWLKDFITAIFQSTDAIGRPDKMILFSEYAHICWLVYIWLEDTWPGESLFLHHKIQPTKRKNAAQPWMEEEDSKGNRTPRILITPINIGGEGLNLTRARHVVLLDVLHDPGKQLQAFRRAAREGNINPEVIGYQMHVDGLMSDKVTMEKAAVQQFLASCGIKGIVAGDTSSEPVHLDS